MKHNLEYYFKKAQKEKFALGQFNFSALAQLEAIVEAAKKKNSPVILGTSEGESRFLGLKQAVALRNAYRTETGPLIFLNLDHGKSFEYIKKAIDV
ncbi:class II fructose-bisphosphate aldolase, partial [Patescibacteria group bacterium]|nr:class II fructose-bisphosphate aldolase [Patescibacteria group bacterium]